MANTGHGADRTTKWIRWIARICSIVIIGFTPLILVIVIGHSVIPQSQVPDHENLLPLAMCLSVAGLGLAWRWEGLGGAISVGFFLADLGLSWAIRLKFFSPRELAVLSPVLITGMLFLVCWWRTRSRSSPAKPGT